MNISKFEVDSIEIATGRMITSIISAVSCDDALRFERSYFGFPHFRVLAARPHSPPQKNREGEAQEGNPKTNNY